ncbi:hypothetical protein PL321_08055 [Caloramator sp. mosi_1]|nr:hypothetical protein [Caloramator sp. mosi_1]WDC85935.1 hypothetical protein PL321_08055 [Caloramator sp. mosi_1]
MGILNVKSISYFKIILSILFITPIEFRNIITTNIGDIYLTNVKNIASTALLLILPPLLNSFTISFLSIKYPINKVMNNPPSGSSILLDIKSNKSKSSFQRP